MNRLLLAALILGSASLACAADMDVTPFRTVSQRPLTRIYGFPVETSAVVAPSGALEIRLAQDVASEYTIGISAAERLVLDGESYRWTVAASYGVGGRFEAGIEIPYVLHGGGFLDGFIEGWHATFGMPQGGRDSAPRDRLSYSYSKNGVQKLRMEHSGSGVGDMVLTGGMKLFESLDNGSHDALALRMAVKLPTGDSRNLRGSGSTDVALSLCGSMNSTTEWGTLGVYGSAGALAMTRGEVLADQQNRLAGFGSLGIGWGPAEWISFKFQLDGHTSLYRDTSLKELAEPSLILTSGGALKLPGGYLLDIGVSEDIAVATAPDVALHLGLSKRF